METWAPANPFEEQLLAACRAEDAAEYLALLRTTELALPISDAAAAGTEQPRWATTEHVNGTWLMAYTSVPSMSVGTGGLATHSRITNVIELAAGWPDLQWGLAVNPGLPVEMFLTSATLARLAAPPLTEEEFLTSGQPPPVFQKLLAAVDLPSMFAGRDGRVSGYVHLLADVSHISSPSTLIEALASSADEQRLVDDDGAVFLLRWEGIGPALYRSPYGGTTEVTCQAVEGWVIEEPPFVGTGFAPSAGQVIREFKADGVGLPHGSEIVKLDREGVEMVQAIWDGDRNSWSRGEGTA